MHFKDTDFGFEWEDARVTRHVQDEKKGIVLLGIRTRKKV